MLNTFHYGSRAEFTPAKPDETLMLSNDGIWAQLLGLFLGTIHLPHLAVHSHHEQCVLSEDAVILPQFEVVFLR